MKCEKRMFFIFSNSKMYKIFNYFESGFEIQFSLLLKIVG